MYARRKIYIYSNIKVGELRIHERIDAARGSRGNSKARRKTAGGDRDAIANSLFGCLAVHRANFRVLDNLRARITQDGVRRQARQRNDGVGRIQVAQLVWSGCGGGWRRAAR